MFQTITTLGLGDIIPVSASSRMLMILVIVLLIALIFDQSLKLSEIISKTSKYDFEFHRSHHVIFMGDFSDFTLARILGEIYKSKSSFGEYKNILIVRNQPPSAEVIHLRDLQMFQDKLFYLQTDVLLESMPRKTNLKEAKAVYVLSNPANPNFQLQDNRNELLLRILENGFPFIPKIVSFHDPKILTSPWTCSFQRSPYVTMISLQAIMTSLMVESCFNPGISTIFCNLFTSCKIFPSFKNSDSIHW